MNEKKAALIIIVPVYNEVDNLDRIEKIFDDYLARSERYCSVLFVDDGSLDGSEKRIEAICARPRYDYISFDRNRGLSTAIKAGIDHCDAPLIGYIDADLQTTPFDFDILVEHIDAYDAVVGYRTDRKDHWNKKIQSTLGNAIRRCMIGDGIIDTGCPLKVFHTDLAKRLPFFNGMHRFLPALVQLEGGRVKQLPVRHFERIAGVSKFNLFNRSLKPLQDLFAYRWMRSRYIHYRIVKSSLEGKA